MKKQFTLIEMLAVVVTIGILMGLAFKGIPLVINRARVTHCSTNLRDVGIAIAAYRVNENVLPFQRVTVLEGGEKVKDVDGMGLAKLLHPYINMVDNKNKDKASEFVTNTPSTTWRCPLTNFYDDQGKIVVSYLIIGRTVPAEMMDKHLAVVRDRNDNHGDGKVNVLLGDGRVRNMPNEMFDNDNSFNPVGYNIWK